MKAILLAATGIALAVPSLQHALESARQAWSTQKEVAISWNDFGSCNLKANEDVAHTEWTATTLNGVPVGLSWEIKVNSRCQWNQVYLDKVVTHEYGHALGLEHSTDPHSIMYRIVYPNKKQVVK